MKYYVQITETLQRVVAVEAASFMEAMDLVADKCNEGTIELTADDYMGRDIDILDDYEDFSRD